MIWIDVLIIVILVVSAIKGWQKGLVLSFFNILGYGMAGFLAKKYYQKLALYIMEQPEVFARLKLLVGEQLRKTASQGTIMEAPSGEPNIFSILKLPKIMEDLLMKSDQLKQFGISIMDALYNHIAEILTRVFVELISILLIFFIAKLLLFFIGYILNGIVKLPVLNGLNRWGGTAFGLLKGLLIVFIILAMIMPFASLFKYGIWGEGLDQSWLAQYLYDHNPIIGLLNKGL